MKTPRPPPTLIEVRSYKHYDSVSFSDDLSHLLLHNIASIDDVNEKLNHFNDLFCSSLDVNAPIKSVKLKCQPHHLIDDDIKQLLKNRDHKLKFLSRL